MSRLRIHRQIDRLTDYYNLWRRGAPRVKTLRNTKVVSKLFVFMFIVTEQGLLSQVFTAGVPVASRVSVYTCLSCGLKVCVLSVWHKLWATSQQNIDQCNPVIHAKNWSIKFRDAKNRLINQQKNLSISFYLKGQNYYPDT